MSVDPQTVIDALAEVFAALAARTTQPRVADPGQHLDDPDDCRRFPAALLVVLAGAKHRRYRDALEVLSGPDLDPDGDPVEALASFFGRAAQQIKAEVVASTRAEPGLFEALVAAAELGAVQNQSAAFDLIWRVFFPEGVGLEADWDRSVSKLMDRRKVSITELNPNPITEPVQEVLFTSNVLVSPGDNGGPPDHWYDHPIPFETDPKATELAHGLCRLDSAIAFELDRNPAWSGPATVLLSVSSTHDGFAHRARELVERVVAAVSPLRNLRVVAFDEPAATRLFRTLVGETPGSDPQPLAEPTVFGVSGAYGRHYSFLKAVSALWSVGVDTRVRATFKIDLDQSFPQPNLVAETGHTALEHLTTPRWGATGLSASGQSVDLALIAGGLVNEVDLDTSIFTPDVDRVPAGSSPEHPFFFSRLPQALSTQAEIVSRYRRTGEPGDRGLVDGVTEVLERVHVTGGTNGVLVEGLRRWRLFTPSVFGRAEDQAYLISGLAGRCGPGGDQRPGYVHEPGLVMSHDKADLIPEIIAQSAASKHVGDLIRTRLFSEYASADAKELLDPFTGCFVSRLPITVTMLRFAVHSLDPDYSPAEARQYLIEGARRLTEAEHAVGALAAIVDDERDQWALYYNALDDLEDGLATSQAWAMQTRESIRQIVDQAEVRSH